MTLIDYLEQDSTPEEDRSQEWLEDRQIREEEDASWEFDQFMAGEF
jgi:hypothetical protein